MHYSVEHLEKEISLPVGDELIRKNQTAIDLKTGKAKRVSTRNKHQMARDLLKTATHLHHIPYEYGLAYNWYCSVENMIFIKKKLKKDFIFGIKSNLKVALSRAHLKRKVFVKLADLSIEPGEVSEIGSKTRPFPYIWPKRSMSMKTLPKVPCFWLLHDQI